MISSIRGGDSLRAATFLSTLERQLKVRLDPALLLDAPTFAALEAQLLARHRKLARLNRQTGDSGPLQVIEQDLRRFLSSWRGHRQSAESLLVGLNMLGRKPLLFWCTQSYTEATQLADLLGPDQPLYVMRSLSKVRKKRSRRNDLLARRYVEELLQIQPQGPYYLGGYCEGGGVAVEMTQLLREQRRDVRLLCLVDHVNRMPLDVFAVLFYCEQGVHSLFGQFGNPLPHCGRLYARGAAFSRLPGGHQVFVSEHRQQVGELLRYEIDRAQQRLPSKNLLPPPTRDLEPECYAHRQIRLRLPRVLASGRSLQVDVELTNGGDRPWEQPAELGLALQGRWLNRRGLVKHPLCAYFPLQDSVAPGETLCVPLTIHLPGKGGFKRLELDLVQEGVDWLAGHETRGFFHWAFIIN